MNAQLLFLFKSLFWMLVFLGRPTTQQQHRQQQHGVKLGSILKGNAFTTVWNAPTELCSKRYNISLDLNIFDIVINPNECFCGDNMTIFYHTQLGYYPYIDEHGALKNGGVPQSGDLVGHLDKAREDIRAKIKGKDFEGLAVIDWEEWRPQWSRNWGKKDEYRKESKTKVKHAHPSWPEDLVAKEAQKEFDKSARDFMEQTARVGQSERPGGLWGYYLFPDCYNYDYNKTGPEYTGQCPDVERVRNDQLLWLWNSSTALYPSIYLERPLKSTKYVRKFVHHRVKEAMRVASMPKPGSIIPVLVYARIVYTYTLDFLSQVDLMHSVGETVSQGASGIILWGDHLYAKSAFLSTVKLNVATSIVVLRGRLVLFCCRVSSREKISRRVLSSNARIRQRSSMSKVLYCQFFFSSPLIQSVVCCCNRFVLVSADQRRIGKLPEGGGAGPKTANLLNRALRSYEKCPSPAPRISTVGYVRCDINSTYVHSYKQ
ncbi:hyaluronidase-1-like isoform X1 [Petromyzon marinus]|uniref:hyaluronidase-1-like isoform X1 n=1 Tax=Petromyzon marinus TaxID=7757 RepID=UPI003F6EC2B4